MPATTDVERALSKGAYRSLRACSVPANDPLPAVIWRRHKWTIIGFGLFLFVELIGLGALGSGMNHF